MPIMRSLPWVLRPDGHGCATNYTDPRARMPKNIPPLIDQPFICFINNALHDYKNN